MSFETCTVYRIPEPSIPKTPIPRIPIPGMPNSNIQLYHINSTYCGSENGSNSNLEDYYAAALMNLPIDQLYKMKKLKQEVKTARDNYKKERKKNDRDGRLLEELQLYNTPDANLPDYTEEIDKWLVEQEKYFDNVKQSNIARNVYPETGALDFTIKFVERVRNFGEMDIKRDTVWPNAFPDIPYPEGENRYFLYHGQVMDPGTLGNVTYSYIGAKYYPDYALYIGGAAVQVKDYNMWDIPYMPTLPYMGDMSEDHDAIELGIKWREEGFPSEEEIKDKLEFKERLRKINEKIDIDISRG
ncbi:polymorphic toxin type 44 domain-containing protein [Butyrivibrio sp. X503]|uniref:polymorphic toxin type 44 domain-containing protein n=1 Tax=Butyrivibrio sp. X503 TaxID=2364878 RepID=UPI001A9BB5F8|nr:polymorphic toxin type 44 domain-containing protein [Butyrivibrio sp. X503]